MLQAKSAGARLAISINASPFSKNKAAIRRETLGHRAREGDMPIVYVNTVGGQDELIFDGGSMVLGATGKTCFQADYFAEGLYPVDVAYERKVEILSHSKFIPEDPVELVYQALVLGVKDYVKKNHFQKAIIGLSGGIDSALTLAIAVDALGKDRVEAVMMPSRYTSDLSLQEAKQQASLLNVKYHVLSIEPIFQAFLKCLAEEFKGLSVDATEENLQARCRGNLLMALSNKKQALVLTTGNKSEMAVGYATLYGDMAGGFCVLKDVTKTMVYLLANYRNTKSIVIPQRVIDRPPSAELAENQLDQDSLPPYSILDEILVRYMEKDESVNDIIQAGFEADTVKRVTKMILRNEYKRRQSAPGIRVTERAFGKDRRYPITSGFEVG